MSSDDTGSSEFEVIPQETLDQLNRDQLIKAIRVLENLRKGRKVIQTWVCGLVAALSMPYVAMATVKLGIPIFLSFLAAAALGFLAAYVHDQTTLLMWKKKDKGEGSGGT